MGARTRARTGAGTGAGTETTVEIRVEGRERLGIDEVVIEVGRKMQEGGDANRQPEAIAARSIAPARLQHYAQDQCPGTGGEGQDRGEWTRGKEAQETPQEL